MKTTLHLHLAGRASTEVVISSVAFRHGALHHTGHLALPGNIKLHHVKRIKGLSLRNLSALRHHPLHQVKLGHHAAHLGRRNRLAKKRHRHY